MMDIEHGAGTEPGIMFVRQDAATATGGESARSPRYGSQRYFWTPSWQRAEHLANYDLLIGDDYQPDSLEDLFAWLDSDDD